MNTICKGVKKASTVGATAALLVAMAPSVALAEEGAKWCRYSSSKAR